MTQIMRKIIGHFGKARSDSNLAAMPREIAIAAIGAPSPEFL